MGTADENAAAASLYGGARVAGMLQRQPRLLQEHSLLRIHVGRVQA
jgi:hypothetical protein